ncbi:DsbA family oxidoreductase [Citricoccus sp. SGAir0253]|uniref:DsbA family oxidoreductase n=1 Tax=Citricoccus sp. SGAir0253 TaxID=2567881 RepID=UPI0010CD1D27|nr:DsbA family oxidoreductase [Citricoccus sp. SGAir0253]QCU78919.1 DsbA family oxidoreductase [Citricoccus sp. SGAir0253]
MKIEIFSDVACPWCYIGKRRFETALAAFEHRDEVEVEWKSFQLDPTLPEHDDRREVDYLAEVKGLPREQVTQMLAHVGEQARGEGLSYDFENLVVANSWRAHRLVQRAKAVSPEAAAALEEELFRAHFEQGLDIGDEQVLARLGTAAGLTDEQVREAFTDAQWEAAVKQDLAAARALGVSGVPFFVLDRRYGISGAQPAELFAQALEQAWAESRPLQMVRPAGAGTGPDGDAGPTGQACGPEGCD